MHTEMHTEGHAWSVCAQAGEIAVTIDNHIAIYSTETLQKTKEMKMKDTEDTSIRRIAYADTEHTSIAGICCFSGQVLIVDIHKQKIVQMLEGAECEVKSVAFGTHGKIAFSTRDGSVWIWQQDEAGIWEIEEILEYSETDVKSIMWHRDALYTCGYDGECVVYSRWEDDMCSVKWEIEQIMQHNTTIWDIAVINTKKTDNTTTEHIGMVAQDGWLYIYTRTLHSDAVHSTQWKKTHAQEVSTYAITALCVCTISDIQYFAMITDRDTLTIYTHEGIQVYSKVVLTEYDEPTDIAFDTDTSAIFITSTQYKNRKRTSKVSKIVVYSV